MGNLENSAQSCFSLFDQLATPPPVVLVVFDESLFEVSIAKIGKLRHTTCIQINLVTSVTMAMERRMRVVWMYPIVLVNTDTNS
jgi:hypothetical protein